jgi:Phosducin
MMDLEDRLLKKNIPGKYSWWDDYKEDRTDDGSDDDDEVERGSQCQNMEPIHTEGLSSSGKSGVKGVLADYKLHQDERKCQAWIDKLDKDELVARNMVGAMLKPGEVSISLAAMRERLRLEKEIDRINDDELNEEDENFLASYRQKRLRELKQANALPAFSGVEDVDPVGYSKAIDETDPRVFIVVHLYETYLPACRSLIPIMEKLSRDSMRDVRFLSLNASTASKTLDPVALPSVLIYRSGVLIGNLTPITNHLPVNFTPQDVEEQLNESIGKLSADMVVQPSSQAQSAQHYDPGSDAELEEFCSDFEGCL